MKAPRGVLATEVIVGVLLIIGALLAACGGEQAGLESAPAMNFQIGGGADESSARGQVGGGQTQAPDIARKLIQNAELHLEVDSCDEARRAIEADLAEAGGFVASARVDHHQGQASRAVLMLRIPATSLGSALASFSKLGTVVHETLDTQDITEVYFDLEARLESARKLEVRLHEILATRAQEVEELLEVEGELGRVRETIERFEGKLRLWESQVAYSTLTVELTTHAVFAAAEPRGLGEAIGATLSNSWRALLSVGRGILLLAVAFLPWLLPLLLVVWLTIRGVQWLERRLAAGAKARQAARASEQG